MAQESWKLDQEESGCQPLERRTYCRNNCGLLGSKATMNLCAKCYRKAVSMQAMVSSDKAVTGQLSPSTTTQFSWETANAAGAIARDQETLDTRSSSSSVCSSSSEGVTSSRPANRCFSCRKRVGLTGFSCRCGNIFCSSHRYAETHNCCYDYKAAGRDAIAKANPLVKARKVEKI